MHLHDLKRHCYAVFETEEEAIWVRNAIFSFKWPRPHGKMLQPVFVPVAEAERGGSFEQSDAPAAQTLDDLFYKTKAKPPIYYLPLSEAQVVLGW